MKVECTEFDDMGRSINPSTCKPTIMVILGRDGHPTNRSSQNMQNIDDLAPIKWLEKFDVQG